MAGKRNTPYDVENKLFPHEEGHPNLGRPAGLDMMHEDYGENCKDCDEEKNATFEEHTST